MVSSPSRRRAMALCAGSTHRRSSNSFSSHSRIWSRARSRVIEDEEMRLSPVAHAQRDDDDDDGSSDSPPSDAAVLVARAPGDPDEPAVALGILHDAVVCQPATIVWYFAFAPDGAAFDIIISNVDVPQFPPDVLDFTATATTTPPGTPSTTPSPQRRHNLLLSRQTSDVVIPKTATLVQNVPIVNHIAEVPQLIVPAGWYQLSGRSSNAASSTTTIFRSSRFFVSDGTDSSCLTGSTTTSATPGGTGSSSVVPPISSPVGAQPVAPRSDDAGNHSAIIAGSIGAIVAVVLLLVAYLFWRYWRLRRMMDTAGPQPPTPTAAWRNSRAVFFTMSTKRKPPPEVRVEDVDAYRTAQPWSPLAGLTPPPVAARAATPASSDVFPPSISSVVATENASTASPRVQFAVPTIVGASGHLSPDLDTRPSKTASAISTAPSGLSEGTDSSLAEERAQLQQEFVLPVTPMPVRDGVMSRTSSVGSDRHFGHFLPGGTPTHSPSPLGPMVFTPSALIDPQEPSPMEMAQAQMLSVPVSRHRLDVPSPALTPRSPQPDWPEKPTTRSPGARKMSSAFVMQVSSRRAD